MKIFDKIFLIVALLIFGASCAYYFYAVPGIEKVAARSNAYLSEKAKGVEWKDISVREFKPVQIEWPEVRPQDEAGKWFFQVFTPPQIWIDSDGNFMTESPYMKEVARQKFAFSYEGVSNEPYPIKYKGYYGTVESPRIEFVNESTKFQFSGTMNKEIVVPEPSTGKPLNLGLTVKSFKLKRVTNPKNGIITQVAIIVINDKKLGRDITIESDKETVLEDESRMGFVAPDGTKWYVKKVGDSTTYKGSRYIVKSLNMGKGEAIIEMIPEDASLDKQLMKLSSAGVENADSVKKATKNKK